MNLPLGAPEMAFRMTSNCARAIASASRSVVVVATASAISRYVSGDDAVGSSLRRERTLNAGKTSVCTSALAGIFAGSDTAEPPVIRSNAVSACMGRGGTMGISGVRGMARGAGGGNDAGFSACDAAPLVREASAVSGVPDASVVSAASFGGGELGLRGTGSSGMLGARPRAWSARAILPRSLARPPRGRDARGGGASFLAAEGRDDGFPSTLVSSSCASVTASPVVSGALSGARCTT